MIRIKHFAFLALLLLTVSCFKHMDPFEGGDGVHMNLDGCKCTMVGFSGAGYVSYTTDGNTYTMSTRLEMVQWADTKPFEIAIEFIDTAPFVTGKKYNVGGKVGNKMKFLLYPPGSESDKAVSMSGQIEFLDVGDNDHFIEALFELDGGSPHKYEIRHGYLRLIQRDWRAGE